MNALPQSQLPPTPPATLLPLERPLPLGALRTCAWLRTAQRAAAAVLLMLIVAICALYWRTFQTQARWEEDYRQLINLRTQSRQLAVLNEALTGDLAGSVALNTPLRVATPAQTLSVPAALERPLKQLSEPPAYTLDIPAGY